MQGKRWTAVVERDEDGWLVATVLELPGCVTQARAFEELEKNVKEAIELYLDVNEIPKESIRFVWEGKG